jgi:hypothetical protein
MEVSFPDGFGHGTPRTRGWVHTRVGLNTVEKSENLFSFPGTEPTRHCTVNNPSPHANKSLFSISKQNARRKPVVGFHWVWDVRPHYLECDCIF